MKIQFVRRMRKSWKVDILDGFNFKNDRIPHVETKKEALEGRVFELGNRTTKKMREGKVAVMYDVIGLPGAHMTVYFGPPEDAHNY